MDINRLRYFIALAQDPSFRRASARVHISQSALWKNINALETELGAPLFSRQGRELKLLDTGRVFLSEAKRMVDEMRVARERVLQVNRGDVGVLRLGISHSASRHPHPVMMDRLTRYKSMHPGVHFDLKIDTSVRLLNDVRDDRLDCAMVFRELEDAREMNHVDLERGRNMVLITSRNHRLAGRKSIKTAELKNEEFVAFTREAHPGLYDQLMLTCPAKGGFLPKIVQTTDNFALGLTYIAASYSVAIMPAFWWFGTTNFDVLSIIPMRDFFFDYYLSYVWKRRDSSALIPRYLDEFYTSIKGDTEAAGENLPQ